MFDFQDISFLYGLLLLVPLALLLSFVLRRKKRIAAKLGDNRLIQQLIAGYSHRKYQLKVIMVLMAIAVGVLAISNPRIPKREQGMAANGIDVVFALDVSKSMLSQDEKPTRLDKAKYFINQVSEQLEGNRIGFVVFAGQAYLQMPLTPDAAALKMFVSNASPDLIAMQGTTVSDALMVSNNALDTKEKKSKALVLITDGEDHDSKADDAAKKLAETGTVVFTVGVGSPDGSPIIDPGTNEYKRDKNGQTVITKLNEDLLKKIAKATSGDYLHLQDADATAASLVKALNTVEKKPISNVHGAGDFHSFYPYLLALAVILLIGEVFISERKAQRKLVKA